MKKREITPVPGTFRNCLIAALKIYQGKNDRVEEVLSKALLSLEHRRNYYYDLYSKGPTDKRKAFRLYMDGGRQTIDIGYADKPGRLLTQARICLDNSKRYMGCMGDRWSTSIRKPNLTIILYGLDYTPDGVCFKRMIGHEKIGYPKLKRYGILPMRQEMSRLPDDTDYINKIGRELYGPEFTLRDTWRRSSFHYTLFRYTDQDTPGRILNIDTDPIISTGLDKSYGGIKNG